jgi:hypothetical protein
VKQKCDAKAFEESIRDEKEYRRVVLQMGGVSGLYSMKRLRGVCC